MPDCERIGVFGVGHPLDEHGQPIKTLWTLYHLPTGEPLYGWACTDRAHMVTEARIMRRAQYHARAWHAKDTRVLVRDVRVRIEALMLFERLSSCATCAPLAE